MEFKTGEWGPASAQGRSKNTSTDSVSVREYLPDNPPSEELSFMRPLSPYIEEAPTPPVTPTDPEPLVTPEALVRFEPPAYSIVLKDTVSSEPLAPFPPEIVEASDISAEVDIFKRPASASAAEIDPPKSKAPHYPAESDVPKGKAAGYPGGGEPFRSKTPGYPTESDQPKGKVSGFSRGGRFFSSKALDYAAESDPPKSKAVAYPGASDAFRPKSTGTQGETEAPRKKQPAFPRVPEFSKTKLEIFAAFSGFGAEELLDVVIDPRTPKNGRSLQAPLTTEETERLTRVVSIYEMAVKVYGDSESGRKWLTGKKRRFDDRTALSMLRTEVGERAVRQFLIQIDEGMFI